MREVYERQDKKGWGYRVIVGNFRINQPHKPCYPGDEAMTKEEAELLAELVETKLLIGLSATVTKEFMGDVWSKAKTPTQIATEEKAIFDALPKTPPNILGG